MEVWHPLSVIHYIRDTFLVLLVLVAAIYWELCRREAKLTYQGSEALPAVSMTPALVPAAQFSLKDHGGKNVSLQDFDGKPVLLNFWATWCPPCVEEMPEFAQFAKMALEKWGLVTIAVSVDESWQVIDGFFKSFNQKPQKNKLNLTLGKTPFVLLLDQPVATPKLYGTEKYPETYLLSKEHKILRRFVGPQKWMDEEMVQWVASKI